VLVGLIAASVVLALLTSDAASSAQAVSAAGTDLTRLLRMMAVLKAAMAAGMSAIVFWRLGLAVTLLRLAGYAATCGAMAAGPFLIWNMTHVVAGAMLLHGGLLAAIVLFWRDPAVAGRLAAMMARRRAHALTR
jgi:hypothetical protein